jgi:hypothetical protein
MAEYIAFSPTVEVTGNSILSIVEAIGEESLPILAKHGLKEINPEAWYPQQEYLDAFRELSELNFFSMVSIGMKIPDLASFPPIDSIKQALGLLDVAYNMNHRGGEIGEYRLDEIEDNRAVVVCRNPYPSDFDYGILYRLLQKFRPATSKTLTVQRMDDPPNRTKGGDTCTYVLEW